MCQGWKVRVQGQAVFCGQGVARAKKRRHGNIGTSFVQNAEILMSLSYA